MSDFDKPSMFEQSRSLIAGAKIIMESEGINDCGNVKYPTSPVIICCALAIEICLKLLNLEEKTVTKKTHNSYQLFNSLPEETKKQICYEYNKENQNSDDTNLTILIEQHKSIFIDWRYAYEKKEDISCSPSFLYGFSFSLNSYIEQNYAFERNDNGWLIK